MRLSIVAIALWALVASIPSVAAAELQEEGLQEENPAPPSAMLPQPHEAGTMRLAAAATGLALLLFLAPRAGDK